MPAPTHTAHSENVTGSSRRKKIKAILASGTVLGIGAVVTMATWNDSQFAEGNFNAGDYGVVSSAQGSEPENFEDHGSLENAATLDFSAPNAAPGDAFAAGLWLKPAERSTYDGEITTISVEASDGQTENFVDVKVRHLASAAECTPNTTAGTEFASGTTLAELNSVDERITLSNAEGADPVQLCFQVTASEELLSNTDASATWHIQTESVSVD